MAVLVHLLDELIDKVAYFLDVVNKVIVIQNQYEVLLYVVIRLIYNGSHQAVKVRSCHNPVLERCPRSLSEVRKAVSDCRNKVSDKPLRIAIEGIQCIPAGR